jgi:hypothetical protein
MDFTAIDGRTYSVWFRIEGATSPTIELTAGARPVVFREYNTDEDIFKPIRAFLCEIQIQTNVNGVTIDTFTANQDTDIEVRVLFGGYTIFNGFLLQDDFEEVWDDGNHYLLIRAADGFGLLKSIPFAVGGAEAIGKYTPLQFIENATSTLYPAGITADYWLLNNLFHDSMVDTAGRHPLNQCYLDAKTFQQEGTEYDDCYTVIEKICRSFGMSMFFYRFQPWFFRPEELYTSYANNLRFANVTSVNQFQILARYDVEVGVGREMQPIMPEMLRSINRRTKFDEIDFYYDGFDEMLQNETFARGTLITSGATSKEFSVDSWTFRRGTLDSTTAGSGNFRAREIYNTSLIGGLLERYIYLDLSTPASTYQFAKSQPVAVPALGVVKFTTDVKWANAIAFDYVPVAWVVLESLGAYYCLNEKGEWTNVANLSSATGVFISLDISASSNVVETEWNTVQVESLVVPFAGNITVYLGAQTYSTANIVYYKNFQFEYLTSFEAGQDIRKILGINSYYNKAITVNNSFKQEIFLDDHFSGLHKGAIFQSDQTTLTDADWYRYRFAGESFGFRRQNDTAHWEHNRFNRNKIDVNMYGLWWDNAGTPDFIGFVNTFRFMDDDINKIYYPANISEIDLVNATWSGTLVEVWDETKDLPIAQTFEADFTTGTYTTATLTVPLTLVTSGGFSIQGGNTARYDAATTLTSPVTVGIFGVVSTSTYPKNVTFTLRKNGTAINTITYPVYVANQAFTFNLSVGNQTIATNDTFTVVISGHSTITINGGDMKINSAGTSYTYDTYTENYLYQ